jgi:hypothetical protein
MACRSTSWVNRPAGLDAEGLLRFAAVLLDQVHPGGMPGGFRTGSGRA